MQARYTVTQPLGRGTHVFHGVAESSDGFTQDVAIMRILPNLTRNKQYVSMFLAGLGSSRRLRHANIVELFDIAKTPEGAYFVVTEYVEGCNLKVLVARRKPVTIQHAIHVMIECCKALTYAHSLNFVPRDLSPRTVLLSSKGEVKIADFGLAQADHQSESSDPGIVKGKFSYLSPEAACGVPVDHRADVFAAGIVLWEMLAGRRLFVGDTDYRTVELVREARFVPIDGLDAALDTVARKALARDASARYQSATDFADALAEYAFSRRIRVSPNDVATLVRDVMLEIRQERELRRIDPQIVAHVQADAQRMTSLLDDGNDDEPTNWN